MRGLKLRARLDLGKCAILWKGRKGRVNGKGGSNSTPPGTSISFAPPTSSSFPPHHPKSLSDFQSSPIRSQIQAIQEPLVTDEQRHSGTRIIAQFDNGPWVYLGEKQITSGGIKNLSRSLMKPQCVISMGISAVVD